MCFIGSHCVLYSVCFSIVHCPCIVIILDITTSDCSVAFTPLMAHCLPAPHKISTFTCLILAMDSIDTLRVLSPQMLDGAYWIYASGEK